MSHYAHTPRQQSNSRLSYQQPGFYNNPAVQPIYHGTPEGLRRYHSVGHPVSAPAYYAHSPSAHSSRSHRRSSQHGHSSSHGSPRHGQGSGRHSSSHHRSSSKPPAVYVTTHGGSHQHGHSLDASRRPHTSSHAHHASSGHKSHSSSHGNHSSGHHRSPSLGDRLRSLFGMHPKPRYVDRHGHETDKWGQPIYST